MAEVKWQARRVSDSVLVDVTADIDGVPQIAPTANAIEGGAGADKDFYASDTDPGAVGSGSVWKDTTQNPMTWWTRNAANNGWNAGSQTVALSQSAGEADVSMQATGGANGHAVATTSAWAQGNGNASVARDAITDGSGTATADTYAEAIGSGAASAIVNATSTTGAATAELKAIRGATTAGIGLIADATSGRMGFFGATPVAKSAAITDATDAATTQARLNTLLAYLRSVGLITP